MASSFVIESVQLPIDSKSVSVLEDVEQLKKEFMESRRGAKRRQDSATFTRTTSTPAISTPTENREQVQYLGLIKSLIDADTQLASCGALREAMETRRCALQEEIRELTREIESCSSDVSDGPEEGHAEIDPPPTEQPKRSRYFDSSSSHQSRQIPKQVVLKSHEAPAKPALEDDLSTVVCPFELLGKCTDPDCPHMHLDR
jgi:hypothetical protein